jgi:hypothetical protein
LLNKACLIVLINYEKERKETWFHFVRVGRFGGYAPLYPPYKYLINNNYKDLVITVINHNDLSGFSIYPFLYPILVVIIGLVQRIWGITGLQCDVVINNKFFKTK